MAGSDVIQRSGWCGSCSVFLVFLGVLLILVGVALIGTASSDNTDLSSKLFKFKKHQRLAGLSLVGVGLFALVLAVIMCIYFCCCKGLSNTPYRLPPPGPCSADLWTPQETEPPITKNNEPTTGNSVAHPGVAMAYPSMDGVLVCLDKKKMKEGVVEVRADLEAVCNGALENMYSAYSSSNSSISRGFTHPESSSLENHLEASEDEFREYRPRTHGDPRPTCDDRRERRKRHETGIV